MSALSVTSIDFDVTRDSRHPKAAATRDQRAWLSWLELGGTRPRTVYDYQWATDVLLAMFPTLAYPDLTDEHVMAALRTFPARSRRVRRAAYASWFKWGRQTRRRSDNPMELVPEIRQTPHVLHDIFDDGEIEALIRLPDPDGILMHILFVTGIRKGEARRLRRQHVNEITAKMTVLNGKGGANRLVPFADAEPAGLQQRLATWFLLDALRPTEHLWYDHPGGTKKRRHSVEIGEGAFVRWWARCIEQADVRYRNPHQTRHTFATHWRQQGLAIDDIQILLGHASIATTRDLYVQTTVEDVERRMAALKGTSE